MKTNNKGERTLKTKWKFKKRLKQLCLKQTNPKQYTKYKTMGAPCSCFICSGENKYNRAKSKRNEKRDY